MSLLSKLLADYHRVLITTDVAPDDVVCLDIVLRELVRLKDATGLKRIGIIANTHDCTDAKRDFVDDMISSRFTEIKDITRVVAGVSTADPHPYFTAKDWEYRPEYAGKVCPSLDLAGDLIASAFGSDGAALVIMISPPYDLMRNDVVMDCCTWERSGVEFGNATLVGCMGANLGWVIDRKSPRTREIVTKDDVLNFTRKFRTTYWCEDCFATGANLAIGDESLLDAMSAKIPHLSDLARKWNGQILDMAISQIRNYFRDETLPDDPAEVIAAVRDRDDPDIKPLIACADMLAAATVNRILQNDINLACFLTMPLNETTATLKPVTMDFEPDDIFATYTARALNADDPSAGTFLVCPDGAEAKERFRARQIEFLKTLYCA